MIFRRCLIGLLLLVCFCHAQENRSLRRVVLNTSWYPQAQFAGYYTAAEKGFYAEEGLEVDFIFSDVNFNVEENLKNSRADFGIMWLHEGIRSHHRNPDIVHIAQFFHNSSILLVAKKERVSSLDQLQGKSVGIWKPFVPILSDVVSKNGAREVEIVPVREGVELLLLDALDAVLVMRYNEYIQLLRSGMEEDQYFVVEIDSGGTLLPEDGLYCRREFQKAEPKLCGGFVRASLRGWEYAINNIDEAVGYTLKYMDLERRRADIYIQKQVLETIKSSYFQEEINPDFTVLNPVDFERLDQFLFRSGIIAKRTDYRQFQKKSF